MKKHLDKLKAVPGDQPVQEPKGKLAGQYKQFMEKQREKPLVKKAQAYRDQAQAHWYQGQRVLHQKLFPTSWEDGAFMDDVRQATLRGAAPVSNILFWTTLSFLLLLLAWAGITEIDEVTHGMGKVIPSSKVQVIQNFDGGTVAEILVREGDLVEKDQPLVRIDDTGFASSYAEKRNRVLYLKAAVARLDAQSTGIEPQFPADLRVDAPNIVAQEEALYTSQEEERKSTKSVMKRQIEQKKQELLDAQKNRDQTKRSYDLSAEQLRLSEEMERKGVIAKMALIETRKEVNDAQGRYDSAKLAVPAAESALNESIEREQEFDSQWKNERLKELAEKRDELFRLTEVMRAVEDKVNRTVVRAPVKGTVKQLLVNTIGGVVKPGEDIVELIPYEDKLLIEARIRPQDIAFISPGQGAMVKLTAYDFSIYGGLKGYVESIGADTVADQKGEAFYVIRVRTESGEMKAPNGRLLPIIPGMIANVDILTGRKTIMDYLLKPFYKVRDNAMRER
ncbi:MAG: HlyD family type I secretion periplasmic adaptor subunit [Proteobacteria bacterium]|nr:HlyD family type I secretion periplasmic adaptor subunit [Pseudomonadota bacterium]